MAAARRDSADARRLVMTPFEMHIDELGDAATLKLEGELDVATAPDLRDQVVRLVSEGRTHLVFDCAGLEFIDSTGLGVLIGARARCLAANGSVALAGTRPAMRRLLAVTGVDGLFPEATAA
jgi:anti-sigma B factor antagonist